MTNELGGVGKELSRQSFGCLLVSSSHFYLNTRGKRYDHEGLLNKRSLDLRLHIENSQLPYGKE